MIRFAVILFLFLVLTLIGVVAPVQRVPPQWTVTFERAPSVPRGETLRALVHRGRRYIEVVDGSNTVILRRLFATPVTVSGPGVLGFLDGSVTFIDDSGTAPDPILSTIQPPPGEATLVYGAARAQADENTWYVAAVNGPDPYAIRVYRVNASHDGTVGIVGIAVVPESARYPGPVSLSVDGDGTVVGLFGTRLLVAGKEGDIESDTETGTAGTLVTARVDRRSGTMIVAADGRGGVTMVRARRGQVVTQPFSGVREVIDRDGLVYVRGDDGLHRLRWERG